MPIPVLAAGLQLLGALMLIIVATAAWGWLGFFGALGAMLYLLGQELTTWEAPPPQR